MTTAEPSTPIGRSEPFARLRSMLGRAVAGSGTLALVGGEAGIGKTHLVAHFVEEARADGAIVAIGGCPVRSEGELPFAAPIEALRSLRRSTAKLADTDVTEAIAELDARMSAESGRDGPDDRPFGQVRLLDAWATALLAIGRPGRPVVLAFEDAHWADRGTLDLIAYLARACRDGNVMLVLTYRSDDLLPEHPLRGLLAELSRLPGTERLELPRLAPDDVVALATERLGRPPSAAEAADLAKRSNGVPYYVEVLLDQGERDGPPPTTIREHLLRRVSSVGPEVRLVVGLVAAVGRPCRSRLIAVASGLSPMIAAAAIEEALGRRLLVRVGDGDDARIDAHHELLRQTIDYEIVQPGGFDLHRRIAEALAAEPRLGGSTELEQMTLLADQATRADLPEVAAGASLRAGRAAEAIFAFEEAATRYAAVLAMAPPADAAAAADLRRRLAESAFLAGDASQAVEALAPAIDLLLEAGDPAAAGAALGRLGRFRAASGDPERGLADLDESRNLLASTGRPDLLTRIHLARARILIDDGRAAEAEAAARDALQAADAAEEPDDASTALEIVGAIAARRGDLTAATDLLAQALARRSGRRADGAPRPSRIGDALLEYADRAAILERTGRAQEAAELRTAGAARAGALGASESWGAYLSIDAARQAAEGGRLDDADVILASVPDPAARRAGPLLDVVRARIAVARGEFGEAQAALDRLARTPDRGQAATADLPILTAELAVWQGQPDAALSAIADAVREPNLDVDLQARTELLAVGLRAGADLAELARFRRRPAELDRVIELTTALEAATRAMPSAGSGTRIEGLRLLGLAEIDRLHDAGDPGWTTALEALDAAGDTLRAAYARWRRAEAALGRAGPDRRAAQDDLVRAAGIASSTGARPLLREVEDLARRSRIDLSGAAAAVSGPSQDVEPGAAVDTLGLSPRELEVLALIVDGRTNRQIAEALFITEKTAAHHVSNLMGKLDVSTRGEAGAMARRLGLVPALVPDDPRS